MLDGLHTGDRRAPPPFRGARVRNHWTSRASRDGNDQADLVFRDRGARFAVRPPPIVRVDLDPISAVLDLIAHDARQPVDAVGLLGALRYLVRNLGTEPA